VRLSWFGAAGARLSFYMHSLEARGKTAAGSRIEESSFCGGDPVEDAHDVLLTTA